MNYATTLFAKLQQLEATPGKNDKLAIIKTFTHEELRLVKLAVDPGVNFYIAQIPSIQPHTCLLYTSPSPRDRQKSRMPSSA